MISADLKPTAFVRYDEHGEVTDWGVMAAFAIEHETAQGKRVMAGGDGKSSAVYVCTKRNRVKLKIDNPTKLEGLALVNVPKPSKVTIDRAEYVVTDGRVDLEFEFPGTYRVEVRSVKHLPAVFEVTV